MRRVEQWLVDRAYGGWHDLTCDVLSMARDQTERQFILDMWSLTVRDASAVPTPEQQARLRDIYEAACGSQPWPPALDRMMRKRMAAAARRRGEAMTKQPRSPPKCVGCGTNRSDPPSKLCLGCEAYAEHQR
jgi:hypothetical protein